jgi:dTDP-4-amino-4,6-dideoxy-D-glucose/dTDP-4-amino-2,4-dideoxy-beta-L-xylose transaminase
MQTIPLFKVFMAPGAGPAVSSVLQSGFIGQGPMVEKFEDLLRRRFKSDYVLTTNSGTSAIHLAIHLLKQPYQQFVEGVATVKWPGIKDGEEVLTTPLSCLATSMPIVANGLKIKWCDIDPTTLNINLDDLERKITDTTKAIVVVHWGGYPVDLDKLRDIQLRAEAKFGFKPAIIEDCAHAFGSRFNGRQVGTHGNICCFSFQAIKHLTCGDGGLLVLSHEELYKKAKLLRWYGIDRDSPKTAMRCEDDVKDWGFKFHMIDIAAAIGLENLQHVDDIIWKHNANSEFYDVMLKKTGGIELLQRDERMESSAWIYSMLVDRRRDFIKHMAAHGIATSQVHERNDKHSCFREFEVRLPILDSVIGSLVSIPVGWWVSDADRKHIVKTIHLGW